MAASFLWIYFVFFACVCVEIEGTKCPYCNIEFAVLGRHTWRCKARITTADIAPDPGILQVVDNTDPLAPAATADLTPREVIPSDIWVCMCGKHCKGKRGLKAHQRSSTTFKSVAEAKYVQTTDVEEVIGSVMVDSDMHAKSMDSSWAKSMDCRPTVHGLCVSVLRVSVNTFM